MGSLSAIAGVMESRQVSESGADPTRPEMGTPGFFEGFLPILHSGRGFEPADHERYAEPVRLSLTAPEFDPPTRGQALYVFALPAAR